jgi:hypothetical protein
VREDHSPIADEAEQVQALPSFEIVQNLNGSISLLDPNPDANTPEKSIKLNESRHVKLLVSDKKSEKITYKPKKKATK